MTRERVVSARTGPPRHGLTVSGSHRRGHEKHSLGNVGVMSDGALLLWTASAGIPHLTARVAARSEAEGWDGLGLVDSQNLAGDPYVELALAAAATERLLL